MADRFDPVWKALSDPTRRAILEELRAGSKTTTELVECFPKLTRFAVMKHMEVLRTAKLLTTRPEGRRRIHSINVIPIRQIYEHWVTGFQDLWASQLLDVKRSLEGTPPQEQPTHD